ncbi:unnamed protein product [Allacma fusca]|uniref:Actin-related protein n=1 Tax=Allacma fusca TaxID=39272 RepID=A0A8J2Q003_9HEXA|nr:unnamed protein product [Allacma fusca]
MPKPWIGFAIDPADKIMLLHLLVTPKDRKVVVVESVFCQTDWRETFARVLYFHYEILNVLWLPSHLAAVSVTGWDTGLVVDMGYEDATVIPVYKGVTILNASSSHALGAKTIDKALKSSLQKNCTNAPENVEELLTEEKIEDIRVRACFVSNKPERAKAFRFEINGDHFLEFDGVAREAAAEVLFQNDDLDGESIPRMVLESLAKCPLDTRKPLARSILVIGGTSMIPGFTKRLLKDLTELTAEKNEDVMEPTEYRAFNLPTKENCVAWLGGSIYGATEATNIRGFTKEYFLKTGVVPDWSNLAHNSFKGFLSGTSTPTASPSKSL